MSPLTGAALPVQVLTNCMILSEGYDETSVGCVLMARPTKSVGLYTQVSGGGCARATAGASLRSLLCSHALLCCCLAAPLSATSHSLTKVSAGRNPSRQRMDDSVAGCQPRAGLAVRGAGAAAA